MAIKYAQKSFEFFCLYDFSAYLQCNTYYQAVYWGHMTEVCSREPIMLLTGYRFSEKAQIGAVKNL